MKNIVVTIFLFLISCRSLDESTPNIVLIIGDDHGWPYYGFMENDIVETPVLDKLANEGVLFKNGHVTSSVCRPSLRTLLTGIYPIQFDNYLDSMKTNFVSRDTSKSDLKKDLSLAMYEHQIIKDFFTLPEMLRTRNYKSFEGGKYWEGTYEMGGFDDGMSDRLGVDLLKDYHILLAMAGGDGLKFARETQKPVYNFLDKVNNGPFFIWYAPMLPHTPFDPPSDLLEIYQDMDISESAKIYYAMCTWFDRSLGEFINYLDKNKQLENTILIYVNDNGWEQDPQIDYTNSLEFSTLGGPKGKKSLYDFGFKTPIIFNYSWLKNKGAIYDNLVSTVDIFTTILDYAGVNKPAYLQGLSIRPLVEGSKNISRKKIINYVKNPRVPGDPWSNDSTGFSYRSDRWHLLWVPDRNFVELYDIKADPYETNEISSSNIDTVEVIKEEIVFWNEEILKRDIFPK